MSEQLSIQSVYAMQSTPSLQHTHDSMVMLIQTRDSLAELTQFAEHRRELVNEMLKRGLNVSPILTK